MPVLTGFKSVYNLSRRSARQAAAWFAVLIATVFVFLRVNITDPNVLEVLFVACGLAGVAAIFWPAALILCGILGVVACERSSQRRTELAKIEKLRRVA